MVLTENTASPKATDMRPFPPQPSPPSARRVPLEHLAFPGGTSGGRLGHVMEQCTRLTPPAPSIAIAPVAGAGAGASSSPAAGSVGLPCAMAPALAVSLPGSTAAGAVAATARPLRSSSSTSNTSTAAALPSTPLMTPAYASPPASFSDGGGGGPAAVAFSSLESDPPAPTLLVASASSPGGGTSNSHDGFTAKHCASAAGPCRFIDERHHPRGRQLRDSNQAAMEDEGRRLGRVQTNCATRRVAPPPKSRSELSPCGNDRSGPFVSRNTEDDSKSAACGSRAALGDSLQRQVLEQARSTRSDDVALTKVINEDEHIIRRLITQGLPPPVPSPPCEPWRFTHAAGVVSPSHAFGSPTYTPPDNDLGGALPADTRGFLNFIDDLPEEPWLLAHELGANPPLFPADVRGHTLPDSPFNWPGAPTNTPPHSAPHPSGTPTNTPPDRDPIGALPAETGGLLDLVNTLPDEPWMLAPDPSVNGPPFAVETPTRTPPDLPPQAPGTQNDTLLDSTFHASAWFIHRRPVVDGTPRGDAGESNEEGSAARGSSLKRPREEEVNVEGDIRTEDNPRPHKKQFRQ